MATTMQPQAFCNITKSKQGVAWQGQIRVKNNDDLVVFVVVAMNFVIDDDLFWIIYTYMYRSDIDTHKKCDTISLLDTQTFKQHIRYQIRSNQIIYHIKAYSTAHTHT